MDEGVCLAAKFALPAYLKGACGTGTFPIERLFECAAGGSCTGVRDELSHFATMYPYLRTLARVLGHEDPFHLEVVRNYWLGGNGLFEARSEHFDFLMAEMLLVGFPVNHLWDVRQASPERFVPFHLHPTLLGYELSGGNSKTLDGVNDCMVRFGVIRKVRGNKVDVSLLSLTKAGRQLGIDSLNEIVVYDERIVKGTLKPGCTIAVHLGWVSQDLTNDIISSVHLLYWTKEMVKIYNQHRADR